MSRVQHSSAVGEGFRWCMALATAAVALLFTASPGMAKGFHTLYAFKDGAKFGDWPSALIPGPDKTLYGVTRYGGDFTACPHLGCGTVFEIARDGTNKQTIFAANGANANGILAITPDHHGNLFGVAGGGANGKGVVFRLHRKSDGSWSEETVYAFTNGADGYIQCFAACGLLVDDSTGTLYGVASGGNAGGGACADGEVYGCGLVYALTPNGRAWTYSVIYNSVSYTHLTLPTKRIV